MTRNEFTEAIDKADKNLYHMNYFLYPKGGFLCDEIYEVLGEKGASIFRKLFKPKRGYIFWFGYDRDFNNQANRHIHLEMFYQTCLSFKLYKEF